MRGPPTLMVTRKALATSATVVLQGTCGPAASDGRGRPLAVVSKVQLPLCALGDVQEAWSF